MIIHHAMTAKIQIWAPPESTSIKKLMFCGSQTEQVGYQYNLILKILTIATRYKKYLHYTRDIISDTPYGSICNIPIFLEYSQTFFEKYLLIHHSNRYCTVPTSTTEVHTCASIFAVFRDACTFHKHRMEDCYRKCSSRFCRHVAADVSA